MKSGQNYGGLDRFRILAAILVIAIHTSPLESYSADADFFLTRILARAAVPFFFMVTGQFVLSPRLASRTRAPGTVRFSRGREQRAVWSYLGRLALEIGRAHV